MPQKQITIRFEPQGVETTVREDSADLLHAAMNAGVHINASCGGSGTCGKCKVKILKGDYEARPSSKLTEDEWGDGYRLACLTSPVSDLTVEVPVDSQYDKKVLSRIIPPNPREHVIAAFEPEELGAKPAPLVFKHCMDLEPPTEDNNASDLERVSLAVKQETGLHPLSVEYSGLKSLSETLRKGDWTITATIAREGGRARLVRAEAGDRQNTALALAVDVGTTTIHCSLLDANSGVELSRAADYNAQASMGEDVITRIVRALKPDGLETLQKRAVKTINGVAAEALKKAGVDADNITHAVFAGNTTMTQLLLGLNPKYIRETPYVPVANYFPSFRPRDFGIDLPESVEGRVMPCVASYVGGDIVSGILATGQHLSPELTLFMDVGTNGEIVIGNNDWLISASASAGPAFEGGGVKFGMRATTGAIEQVRINRENLEPMILTIGKVKPKGVCGSGMIDCLAEFMESGIISQNGKINYELASKTPRIREGETGWEYVLCWESETQLDQDLCIIEPDIDNLIRTKASIYAACSVLLKNVGLHFSDIERIILAGGFGRYIDVEKAMAIGLLPEVNPEIVSYGGNTSLAGSKLACLYGEKLEEADQIASKITNIELSASSIYMDEYVAALFLPHTRMEDFPAQTKRLNALSAAVDS